jgi:uncharacterized protein (TIGR03086 family)
MTSTSDPRAAFAAATRATLDVVLDLPAQDLGRSTPCTELDVAALRGHLLTVFRRVAHVGRGGAPADVPPVPAPVEDVDGALRTAADDALAVWSDPALLTRELAHPAGTMPGAALLATYVGELVTHAWDVGTAVGRPVVVADDVVAVGSAASHQLLPRGERPPGFPFGPEVAAPADASPLEALVAWQGRDPRAVA